jgi:predicted urease superfamily metal-dependent hydrolase
MRRGETVEGEKNGVDVELNLGGQKLNVKNVKSVNTFATVATLVAVCVIGYAFYVHAGETKDASKELTQALKEMTQAAREQNCLISMPQERRDPELCRRLAR